MAISERNSTPETSDTPLSFRVVNAVADAKGLPPSDVGPMFGALDLESLDSLYANSDVDLRLDFTVQGCRVEIRGDAVRAEAEEQ